MKYISYLFYNITLNILLTKEKEKESLYYVRSLFSMYRAVLLISRGHLVIHEMKLENSRMVDMVG